MEESTPTSHKLLFLFVVLQLAMFLLYYLAFYKDLFNSGGSSPKIDLDEMCKSRMKTQECQVTQTPKCPVVTSCPVCSGAEKKEYRVISFGLYGANPRYTFGAIRNSEMAKVMFPDWKVRWYHDNTVPREIIQELRSNGDELIDMSAKGIHGGVAGMLWRFLVAGDQKVDRFMVRDCDARFNLREKAAIDEWIASGKTHHIIKDHPAHGYDGTYPMLGGMWGGKGVVKGLVEQLAKWSDKQHYMGDMNFLRAVFNLFNQSDIISHDTWTCERYPYARPYPTRRFVSNVFVEHSGQVFDGNDNPVIDHMNMIRNQPAPMKCRGKPQWQWG